MSLKPKLSTESYKGVRDLYPEDMFVQNYIFSIWRKVVESFGYSEYNASILEPAELYKAKSGDEIVNEQTYTFTDRGDREVTLRPEMTPTVARMVAGRQKELVFPLRWFSIPNLFRYEKPQRGRMREHFQLNVDMFGIHGSEADTEIISIAYKIMKAYGAQDSDFIIKINNRKLVNDLYEHFGLSLEEAQKISKVIDKKDKISGSAFEDAVREIIADKTPDFIATLTTNEKLLEALGVDNLNAKSIVDLIEKLQSVGISNVLFDPTLMRGFDYYTGMVFEVFDTHPDNYRSIFGGGRYDDLLDIFGSPKIPTIGFGAGDITARDFLEVHDIMPQYRASALVYICTIDQSFYDSARKLAEVLRDSGINTALDLSDKKLGDQVKSAHKQLIPFVICIGEDEAKSGMYPLKNLETGEEKKMSVEEIIGFFTISR